MLSVARSSPSLTPVRGGSRKASARPRFALIPAMLVSFAIGVMLSPSPSSIQNEATPVIPYDGHDRGLESLGRFAPVGGRAGGTPAAVMGMRWASLLSGATVFPILSPAIYSRVGQLLIPGLTKTAIEAGPGIGIFGPQALLPEDGSEIPTSVGLWRSDGESNGIVRLGWPLTTFEETPKDLKSASGECPGKSCPDVAAPAGQDDEGDSSEGEDSASSRDAPSTQPGSMEITYDPSPPSVASPALGGLCDARLLAFTPPPFLVACGASTTLLTGDWSASFEYGKVEGSLDSSDWHVRVDIGSGFHVFVGSAVPDLLDEFGINQIRGTTGPARTGLQSIGTSASAQVLKNAITPTEQFFAGITSRGPAWGYFAGMTPDGPAGGVMLTSGQFGAQLTATTPGGQVQLAGALTFQTGDFSLGYTWGTDGSGLIGRFKRDPFDVAIALIGSDVAVGFSYTPDAGPTVQASWSGTNGLEIAAVASYKISLGATGLVLEPVDRAVTLPLGKGTLVLTPASPPDGPSPPSVNFERPLQAPPASPPAPASGATLIVRACVATEGKTACGREDSPLGLQVLVDGRSVTPAAQGIPVAPGLHVVTVPSTAVPPRLVPLRGLRCDLAIPAASVGTCELPFRWVGTPDMNPPRPVDTGR